VDDNHDAADSLAMLLELMGAEVRTTYDGTSALEEMRSWLPSVVFLDLGMPGMDGYATAAQVRSDPQIQDVTLVAVTGWGQYEDRRRTKAVGFDAHLVKPVASDSLVELLGSVRAHRLRG
jgi:CheY-like chemotaxis protein